MQAYHRDCAMEYPLAQCMEPVILVSKDTVIRVSNQSYSCYNINFVPAVNLT